MAEKYVGNFARGVNVRLGHEDKKKNTREILRYNDVYESVLKCTLLNDRRIIPLLKYSVRRLKVSNELRENVEWRINEIFAKCPHIISMDRELLESRESLNSATIERK